MKIYLTFDLEEFDLPTEGGVDIPFDQQMEVSNEGCRAVVSLLEKYRLTATFYITANYALHNPALVKSLADKGHEIASHDYYHSLTPARHPSESKRVLESISGTEVVGYRAPRMSRVSNADLLAAGYHYNSSLNPTYIPGRYNALHRPRTLFEEEGLIQFPVSVAYPLRIPLFWLSLHHFPLPVYRWLARSAIRKDGYLHLYFHPWEFNDRIRESAFCVSPLVKRGAGNALLRKLEHLIVCLLNERCSFERSRAALR